MQNTLMDDYQIMIYRVPGKDCCHWENIESLFCCSAGCGLVSSWWGYWRNGRGNGCRGLWFLRLQKQRRIKCNVAILHGTQNEWGKALSALCFRCVSPAAVGAGNTERSLFHDCKTNDCNVAKVWGWSVAHASGSFWRLMSKDDYLSLSTIKRLYGQNRRSIKREKYC